MRPYLSSDLKSLNRQTVFDILCDMGQVSKSDIARISHISAPTVMKIIDFFIEKEMIREVGEGVSALGRKPQLIELNPNRYYAIGVIHEGDTLKVGLVNLLGDLKALRKIRINQSFFNTVDIALPVMIDNLLADMNVNSANILGIGIGIPGIYDVENSEIIAAPLIGIYDSVNISENIRQLSKKHGIPVVVDNDLNLEVIGEFKKLNLSKNDDLLYLSLGTGFGAGVILNGQLRRGSRYMCGEIGYMAFSDAYKVSSHSAGWLESKINLSFLQQKFGFTDETPLSEALTAEVCEYVKTPFALAVNNLLTCLDCSNVSVGGGVFDLFGDALFEAIRQKVSELCISQINLTRQVCEEPGIIGAAEMVSDLSLQKFWSE